MVYVVQQPDNTRSRVDNDMNFGLKGQVLKIVQLAIVRMNSLNQKPYETKTIISVGLIQAEITKVT